MLNKYYQDELHFLRELGREFSRAYPEAAPFLGEAGADPDVERLLEGFAFLSGGVRQKLDDEIPEFTHAMLNLFWPHYLRPFPSATIVQFEPGPQAAGEIRTIERGAEIDSVPVDGTPCRFRTTSPVDLLPMVLEAAELRRGTPPALALRLRLLEGASLAKLRPGRIRLHLSGDAAVGRALYLCLCNHLRAVKVKDAATKGDPVAIPGARARAGGLEENEALVSHAGAAYGGFRAIHEYFAFPARFLLVDIEGLDGLAPAVNARTLELLLEFDRVPENLPAVSTANVALNCSPAVNLFYADADPIRMEVGRNEYRVRPAGHDPAHTEVYDVRQVSGVVRGMAKPREYTPLFRAASIAGSPTRLYYETRTRAAVRGEGADLLIMFRRSGKDAETPEAETVSLELICTNRALPTRLGPGDIRVATDRSPAFARFRNITKPTSSVPPPAGDDVSWRLMAHLSLNLSSITSPESLRNLIGIYNFRARVDRQSEAQHRALLSGIAGVRSRPRVLLVRGSHVRCIEVEVDLDEETLGGEGDAWLFGTVLNELLSQHVTLNTATRLTVKGTRYGNVYTWTPRTGRRPIL